MACLVSGGKEAGTSSEASLQSKLLSYSSHTVNHFPISNTFWIQSHSKASQHFQCHITLCNAYNGQLCKAPRTQSRSNPEHLAGKVDRENSDSSKTFILQRATNIDPTEWSKGRWPRGIPSRSYQLSNGFINLSQDGAWTCKCSSSPNDSELQTVPTLPKSGTLVTKWPSILSLHCHPSNS